jgi:hypothetical protein
MPNGYTVAGSPVTSSGTLAVTGGPVGVNGNVFIRYMGVFGTAGAITLALGLTCSAFSTGGALGTASWLGSMTRALARTAAAINSQFINSWNTATLWFGNAAGRGGFQVEFTVGYESVCSRAYFGLATAPIAVTAADPSAATNCILVGNDVADANLQIMHNDAAGTCTKVDLGVNFPLITGLAFRVVFSVVPNGTTVAYTVTRLDSTGFVATGTLSTNLPSTTTFLQCVMGVGNAAVPAVMSLAFLKLLIEEYAPA